MSDRSEFHGRTGDPLALFMVQLASDRGDQANAAKPTEARADGVEAKSTGDNLEFESGEHLWLGNAGLKRACAACGEDWLDHLRTRRGSSAGLALTYGEIVALSGDFYGDPDSLFDERDAYLPWFAGVNDVAKLRALFAREMEFIDGRRVDYPDNNLAYWWSAKNYVELAVDNVAHFGWHNVLAYCKHHTAALELARESRRTGDKSRWRRAIYTNGFADHFLTDGFAAGHIRVPREQTRAWAARTGRSEKLAGALSMLLHDQDGHVHSVHGEGGHADVTDRLRVRNSRGDEWSTYCDGQLFIARPDDPAIEQPVSAVAASFAELLRAYRGAEILKDGEPFAALMHVPFPHPDAMGLCEKFPADMDAAMLDRLMERVRFFSKIPWVGPGLTREDVVEYLKALPGIVEAFREDVRACDSPYLPRVPRAYREAFARIS